MQVRLPEDLLLRVEQISLAIHQTPSALARVLLEEYVSAFESHHGRLPWPPAFQYFAEEAVETAPEEQAGEHRPPLYVKRSVPGRRVFLAADPPATGSDSTTPGKGGSRG